MPKYLDKVSVLIPCYNQATHIQRVVDAVIQQTRPPDEIIVVDDASTDDSIQMLHKLPIKLICHKINKGPAVARNTAFEASTGDLIIYIDSDAYADTRLIENILASYSNPQQDNLGGVGGRGIEVRINNVYDRWRSIHARQDFGLHTRDNVPYLFGLCMSFKRETLLDVQGFDPFFPINAGEDLDLGYRLKRAGFRLRYTPDAIVYHQHTDTEEKLKQTQYNWYYWSYLAKKRNDFHPWTLLVGSIRRLITDTISDFVIRRNKELAKLDIHIFHIKIKAIKDAAKIDS